MKRLTLLVVLISLGLLLVACGGSSAEPEAAPAESNSSNEEAAPVEEEAAEAEAEEEAPVEEEAEPVAEESEPAEVEAEEEAPVEEETDPAEESDLSDGGFGDLPLTGTDPDSGLVINPPDINPGETILIRGEIISMNLTPTTSPEFLIQVEDGINFRFRSQDLEDTYFVDGSQLRAFEYKLGMLAQATIMLAADAGPSDLATSEDLILFTVGER